MGPAVGPAAGPSRGAFGLQEPTGGRLVWARPPAPPCNSDGSSGGRAQPRLAVVVQASGREGPAFSNRWMEETEEEENNNNNNDNDNNGEVVAGMVRRVRLERHDRGDGACAQTARAVAARPGVPGVAGTFRFSDASVLRCALPRVPPASGAILLGYSPARPATASRSAADPRPETTNRRDRRTTRRRRRSKSSKTSSDRLQEHGRSTLHRRRGVDARPRAPPPSESAPRKVRFARRLSRNWSALSGAVKTIR